MILSDIQTEVQARGFSYDSVTRLNYWINVVYHRICESQPWSFLETTSTGSSPLTIADLQAVLSVTDTTNKNVLGFEDFRTLNNDDPTLATTGPPYCWYQSAPTVISTYPTTTVNLSVRYLKVPTDLSSGSDTPIFPSRYHYLIVDGVAAFGYADADNAEGQSASRDAFDEGLLAMSDSLNFINYDSPRSMVVGSSSTDW